jgi:hypothetical protein
MADLVILGRPQLRSGISLLLTGSSLLVAFEFAILERMVRARDQLGRISFVLPICDWSIKLK